MSDVLVAEKVTKRFGGLLAVHDVTFGIPEGSIVSLIGPNGAGKTTFFNMLTGVYTPTSGRIVFRAVDVTGKPPHAITELGVGRTFQNIRLFQHMTALENVLVGMHSRLRGGILGSILRTPRVRREERGARDRARQLVGPLDREDAFGGDLVEPEVVDLTRIVESIQIDVKQRQPTAAIFLHDRERWTAHVVGRDAESFGETADEHGLSRAEIAVQQHDVTGRERARQLAGDCCRFVLGSGDCGPSQGVHAYRIR
jgi:ABC-type uncharacterized transport system ATPase subunit